MMKLISVMLSAVSAIEAGVLLADEYYGRHAVVLGYRVVRDLMPAEEHSHGRAPRDGTVRVRRAVSSTSADLDYIFGRNV